MIDVLGKKFYNISEISKIYGLKYDTIKYRIRVLNVKADFVLNVPVVKRISEDHFSKYYSIDKVNHFMNCIQKSNATSRKRTKYMLVESKMNNEDQYEYFELKMNYHE